MTSSTLAELRDRVDEAARELEELRDARAKLLPALHRSKAPKSAIIAAFGMTRAAFYKNGYNEVPADSTTPDDVGDEWAPLIEQATALTQTYNAKKSALDELRLERKALVLSVLAAGGDPAQLVKDAGITKQWLSLLRSQQ